MDQVIVVEAGVVKAVGRISFFERMEKASFRVYCLPAMVCMVVPVVEPFDRYETVERHMIMPRMAMSSAFEVFGIIRHTTPYTKHVLSINIRYIAFSEHNPQKNSTTKLQNLTPTFTTARTFCYTQTPTQIPNNY